VAGVAPAKSALRKPLVRQPKSLAVVHENAQSVLPAIAEHEQPPRERIGHQHLATHARQAVDPFAEIDRLHAYEDAHLRRDLDHRC
jgi:hypothetical protein